MLNPLMLSHIHSSVSPYRLEYIVQSIEMKKKGNVYITLKQLRQQGQNKGVFDTEWKQQECSEYDKRKSENFTICEEWQGSQTKGWKMQRIYEKNKKTAAVSERF